jgi:hypothetical protein
MFSLPFLTRRNEMKPPSSSTALRENVERL